MLADLGAWQRLSPERVSAYETMRVWDESSSPDSDDALSFDAAEFAVPQLGFIVENELLQAALVEVLRAQAVELVFDAPIASLDLKSGTKRILTEDGVSFAADLVIGADGVHSLVRESAGIDTQDHAYGQTAFVTHLVPEKPHRSTAWQRFLRTGPLGILPLHDGRVSVVWSTTDEQAQWAMSASAVQLGQALGEASGHVLGELAVDGPRGVFLLQARHAKGYVKAGLALIGDAAHAVHPLAGQGANLGLQDAVCLADVISEALQNGEYPADRPVLRRYERARKGANATMMHFLTGLNRLFATDSGLIQELRTTGMRVFNKSGPLREHVVGVALGMRR